MKIEVLNEQGVKVLVDAEHIKVKGITLDKLFTNFENAIKEFKEFKMKAENVNGNEQTLK